MRSLPKVLVTIALAIIVVVFCFFSHAHSEVPSSTRARVPLSVAAPVPTFFENLPEPAPEPYTPPPARRIQVALARICVSESGFQVYTNDCTLIYHALRTRSSTGEITLGIMRAYSGRTFDTNRTDGHRWIPHLNHNFTEPRGWRETVTIPWSSKRAGFQAVYEHVGTLLRTRPENPCDMRVDHWGARGFRRDLHLGNGWRLIDCGETLNDFWSMPRGEENNSNLEEANNRDVQSTDNISM